MKIAETCRNNEMKIAETCHFVKNAEKYSFMSLIFSNFAIG